MQKLLNLLKDGHARTTTMLAAELNTTPSDIRRKLEYMENMGIIRRVSLNAASCGSVSCSGCSSDQKGGKSGCAGCIPNVEILNMGEMWEVVKK